MLKEAIETIKTLVVAGREHRHVDCTELRNATLYNVGGDFKRVDDEPAALAIVAGDVEAFLQIVNDRPEIVTGETNEAGDIVGAAEVVKPPASIWHHDNDVVGVLNDLAGGFRDDRVRLSLDNSTKFERLKESGGKMRDHRDFVRFVVENFRDALKGPHDPILRTA